MAPEIQTAQPEQIAEAGLIQMIVEGRQDLFDGLVAPHLNSLSRVVQSTIGIHQEVEDIVQLATLKAFTHLRQFRFEASFRTWFIRIGLNEARQWRRKQASGRFGEYTSLPLTDTYAAGEHHSPLNEYQRAEAVRMLNAAIARLSEKYRAVILLRDLEDLSISEVAGKLGLTIPAVKSRHLRARKKVAKLLGTPMCDKTPHESGRRRKSTQS